MDNDYGKVRGYGSVSGAYCGGSVLAAEHDARIQSAHRRELPEQLEALNHATEVLTNSLASLDDRLTPVMRSEPPSPGGTSGVDPNAPATGYAATIYEVVQRLHRIAGRVNSITDRLEV